MKNLQTKASMKQRLSGSSHHHILTGVIAAGLMMLPGLVGGSPVLAQQKTERNSLTYGKLIEKADKGEIKKVELDQAEQIARVYLVGQKPNTLPLQVRLLEQNTELINKLKEKNVDFGEVSSAGNRAAVG
ncbi:MAG: cell division protein FtsH, partial [Aphanizomenon sp.]